jgi:uncharacterized iron-regulated protein
MLTVDQQPIVDGALARAPRDPDALAEAVGWHHSRWPAFEMYRPIFAAGLEAGTPIVAANLARDQVKQIVSKGRAALDDGLRVRLARAEPIPDAVMSDLREEMDASHCGHLPASLVDPLVLAQRARDARMAERMVEPGAGRGAVLITGRGHARIDRGVPAVIAADRPDAKVVSVGFVEVDPAALEPSGYREGGGGLPYDLVVFTPGLEREDPCEGMKGRMESVERRRGEAGQEKPRGDGENAAPDAANAAPGAAKPAAP